MSLEEHIHASHCLRCKKKSEKEWESEFSAQKHYLTKECEHCGYELFFQVPFITSGTEKKKQPLP